MEINKMETYATNVGKNIKKYRKQRNITQIDLAKKLNVSNAWLCKLENGNRNTTIFRLSEIANVLNITLMDLIE
jgi:transcriptional regulator with XRE-family HTH domain